MVLRSGDQIDQLTELGLESDLSRTQTNQLSPEARLGLTFSPRTHIMEQLQQVDVISLPPEMLLEEEIDGTFEHERVVDRNVTDTGL